MRGQGKDGYLTVYAALSLAVLLSLFLVLLEGARYNAIQMEAALVTDIAMDSVLAEYHREMLNQYGMFWIDTSYGTTEPSIAKLQDHLKGYMEKNLDMTDVFLGDYLYRDFLAMRLEGVTIAGVALATDGDGKVFRDRATEVIQSDAGLDIIEQVADWLDIVEIHELDQRNVEAEKESIDRQIETYNGTEKKIGEEWVTIEVENPTKVLDGLKKKGILEIVVSDEEAISTAGINLDSLISGRRNAGAINSGNWTSEEEEGQVENLTKRLLWQEYLLHYCGFYGAEKVDGTLQYQVEYLIAGKDNDVDNLKNVVHRICALREAANAVYLFSDQVKCAEAEAVAAVVSAALMIPEAEPLFQAAILLGWAYVESLHDVECLLAGQKVPLLKTEASWYCDVGSALEGIIDFGQEEKGAFASEKTTGDNKEGLSYQDYLRLLLALSPLTVQTFRMMDIVEMDIRQTPGNGAFRMDGCVDKIKVELAVVSDYGYHVTIHKEKRY